MRPFSGPRSVTCEHGPWAALFPVGNPCVKSVRKFFELQERLLVQYWLVSQNTSWEQERQLSVLWSPRTNVNGRRVAAYERLQEALPGDVVFNYSKGNFRAASTVLTRAVPALRPYG